MSEMRLQKWLSQLGVASRREAEKWISEGRLAVNGKVVSELGTKVNPETDSIALDGRLVKSKVPPKVYWLLHKPDKILTARSDELTNKPTIYDLPMVAKAKFLVSPVGRLDFRTEGLLLLTNDGDLSYKLCRPEYHVPREYQVLLDGRLTKEEEQAIKKGITLEDGPVRDVKITYVHGANMGVSTGSWYVVTVHEGRNRLVRRLFEHFNRRVVRLIRIGFGDIRLPGDLPSGEYRQLTNDQVATLRKSTEKPMEGFVSERVSKAKGRSLRKPLSQRPRAKKTDDDTLPVKKPATQRSSETAGRGKRPEASSSAKRTDSRPNAKPAARPSSRQSSSPASSPSSSPSARPSSRPAARSTSDAKPTSQKRPDHRSDQKSSSGKKPADKRPVKKPSSPKRG